MSMFILSCRQFNHKHATEARKVRDYKDSYPGICCPWVSSVNEKQTVIREGVHARNMGWSVQLHVANAKVLATLNPS